MSANPRMWVMCMLGHELGCAKEQTIGCKTDWRLLVSLWCTDPMYHELKQSHGSYESQHDWWRDRYKVAATDISIRPKIRGIGWHRLRANAAALIEWLRICSREGWLHSARRNGGKTARGFADRASASPTSWQACACAWASQRFGEKALLLGHGQRTPPSRRPRGSPPGQTTLDLDITT